MTRWQRGEAEIEQMLADGELQLLTGAAADGQQWLSKARRTLGTATGATEKDPDSAFTLAHDAARFACTALLAQQGLRARQRNDIEYPLVVAASLTPDDAGSAIALATELADAADQLLPHLGLFGSRAPQG